MRELQNKEQDFKTEKRKLTTEIVNTLNRHTTTNQLKANWKEISKYVDEVYGDGDKKAPLTDNLPAVRYDDLNKKIGL